MRPGPLAAIAVTVRGIRRAVRARWRALLLTVAAVLTSLYPGVTVALGAVLLHERPDAGQKAGLLLGAVAVTAIVVA